MYLACHTSATLVSFPLSFCAATLPCTLVLSYLPWPAASALLIPPHPCPTYIRAVAYKNALFGRYNISLKKLPCLVQSTQTHLEKSIPFSPSPPLLWFPIFQLPGDHHNLKVLLTALTLSRERGHTHIIFVTVYCDNCLTLLCIV